MSAISFWEISLKSALGKLAISGFGPGDLPDACLQTGFEILPLLPEDSSSYHLLKATQHKDPFDRMLIWIAIRNKYTLLSSDDNVKKYKTEGLRIFTDKGYQQQTFLVLGSPVNGNILWFFSSA